MKKKFLVKDIFGVKTNTDPQFIDLSVTSAPVNNDTLVAYYDGSSGGTITEINPIDQIFDDNAQDTVAVMMVRSQFNDYYVIECTDISTFTPDDNSAIHEFQQGILTVEQLISNLDINHPGSQILVRQIS